MARKNTGSDDTVTTDVDGVDPDPSELEDAFEDDVEEAEDLGGEPEPTAEVGDLAEADAADAGEQSASETDAGDTAASPAGDEDDAEDPDALPATVAFDDDQQGIVAAVAGDDELDADAPEGVREGEFVCRSCYMAKRDTQLADPDRLLCRDCA